LDRRGHAGGVGPVPSRNPGNRGGSGRPSLAYGERCRWIADLIVNGTATKIAKDADHPLLVQVWRLADERGYGKRMR